MSSQQLLIICHGFSLVLPVLLPGLVLIATLKNKWLKSLDKPIDGDIRVRGRPLLGTGKTYRGVVIYVVGALLVSYALYGLSDIEYIHPLFKQSWLVNGLLFGGGYAAGELINSMIKRQFGVQPGKLARGHVWARVQQIVDHVDGMVVVAILLYIVHCVQIVDIMSALAWGVLLHGITNIAMNKFHLRH